MKNPIESTPLVLAGLAIALVTPSVAQDSAAEEMARKLQDPLANISAVLTDNDILFKTGDDEVSYSIQIQPVQAFAFEERGFNFVARGILPILGMAPESQKPNVGEPLPAGGSHTWGIGDVVTQFFFSPRNDGAWKWGLGPMVSWRTRSNPRLAGAGWGGGPIGVLVGNLSDKVSSAFVAGNLWGQNGFNTAILNPMIFYNLDSVPGMAISYSNTIVYDWSADSKNALTVPLGLGVSRTFGLANGSGLDIIGGVDWNAERPEGAAEYSLKWGVSMIFP